jgi:hypothetical protein
MEGASIHSIVSLGDLVYLHAQFYSVYYFLVGCMYTLHVTFDASKMILDTCRILYVLHRCMQSLWSV